MRGHPHKRGVGRWPAPLSRASIGNHAAVPGAAPDRTVRIRQREWIRSVSARTLHAAS